MHPSRAQLMPSLRPAHAWLAPSQQPSVNRPSPTLPHPLTSHFPTPLPTLSHPYYPNLSPHTAPHTQLSFPQPLSPLTPLSTSSLYLLSLTYPSFPSLSDVLGQYLTKYVNISINMTEIDVIIIIYHILYHLSKIFARG